MVEKNTTQTANVDKETMIFIKNLRKGKPIKSLKDFAKISKDDYVFCCYPRKDSSIYKKTYAFGLCCIFKLIKGKKLKTLTVYGYEIPISIGLTKDIDIDQLNLKGCSFNILNQKQYDMINKIVLANAIIKSNEKD